MKIFIVLLTVFIVFSSEARTFEIPHSQLSLLLEKADRDLDKKITVDDEKEGPLSFELKLQDGTRYSIQGAYLLSNLLQEMKLREADKIMVIPEALITEKPVERTSRLIKDMYWDGLTRKIDEEHLRTVLADSKVTSQKHYLYIPHSDPKAFAYYEKMAKEKKDLNLVVVKLPEKITDSYVNNLGDRHGLLSLALDAPYVVPGGRFNELYGWDSYFITLGLLQDGKIDLARSMVDNLVYEISHYGKILNANRTYYLTRSQPPFLTSMIRAVFEKLPDTKERQAWLRSSLEAAEKEYREVWVGKERLTSTGLSRYTGFAQGIPPEVEKGHFNEILKPYLKKYHLSPEIFIQRFNSGKIIEPELTEFFLHDRAVRESGHDTTYRWRVNGKDRCADFVTVDLNALLLKYELDFAYLYKFKVENKQKSELFLAKAKARTKLMKDLLWDKEDHLFYDYNWKDKKRSQYLSAVTFYPLWAFEPSFPEVRVLNDQETKGLISRALLDLEAKGGLVATSERSLNAFGDPRHLRQWEYPNGWAPHQMLAWKALSNFKFKNDEQRLIYKWLHMIARNAMNYNGTIPEKYDVVSRSHDVFAEYGNVGTKFSYITKEGFGWMNASFEEGLSLLEPKYKKSLDDLISPENLKFQ